MESINLNGSFSLAQTMECGQCFRWEALEDGTYTGVVSGVVYRLRQNHDTLQCAFSKGGSTEFISKYLDLDRDYDAIRRAVSINEYMKTVSDFGYGIRILRQEPWEALCSFIISQCNNIPRIKSIISRLCVALGEEISFEREKYFSFPSAEKIARLEVSDLDFLRSGYRAPYIIGAARAVFEGKLDLESLRDMNTSEGKEILRSLEGVGEKVASCALLFGIHRLDAFPVDVWMKRAVELHFEKGFDPSKVFGEYAGIAQQYMFYHAYMTKLESESKQ